MTIPRPSLYERKTWTLDWNINAPTLRPEYGGRLTIRLDFYDHAEATATMDFINSIIDKAEGKL